VKLLVIGADGFAFRMLQRFGSKMPFLKAICEQAQWGQLISIAPGGAYQPFTGPAWATLYTGVLPETHGITTGGWLLEHMNYADIKTITIWEIIQETYRLGLFTMPMTYPPFPLNGWIVSGFPAPAEMAKCVYPRDILGALPQHFRIDYCDGREEYVWRSNYDRSTQLEILRVQVNTAITLAGMHPVDVLAFGTTILDRYGHVYPLYQNRFLARIPLRLALPQNNLLTGSILNMVSKCVDSHLKTCEELLEGYTALDQALQTLYEQLNPEMLFLFSDHGFHRYGIRGNTLHDYEGTYVLYKPGIRAGCQKRHLVTIAGSVLDILGLPTDRLGETVSREKTPYTSQEAQHIEDRLKGLGYLASYAAL